MSIYKMSMCIVQNSCMVAEIYLSVSEIRSCCIFATNKTSHGQILLNISLVESKTTHKFDKHIVSVRWLSFQKLGQAPNFILNFDCFARFPVYADFSAHE